MISFEYWRRHGTFIAFNLVIISIIVQLMIRGSWGFSGFAILILVVADLFVGRILRSKNETSGQAYSTSRGGRFFRFYGCALALGGLIWLAQRMKVGITWADSASFVVLILLAVAMLSIGKKMNTPTSPDREGGPR
jgi:hypothetical protein